MRRSQFLQKIEESFRIHRAVALLGPRQCGKTTVAKQLARSRDEVHFFDLENPVDMERLEQPMLAFEGLSGLVIIDELQRRPELFPVLRVLLDQTTTCARRRRFLFLGSASRDLIRQSSESLAGRVSYLELYPFSFGEARKLRRLHLRGGFPRSYLADSDDESGHWRDAYVATFLERDLPNLGIRIPPLALRRFWMMLAHYHGQIFNASELGRSLGIADTTVRRYLDVLTGTFMIRTLLPWSENLGKRQVKSPKIYFRDSGIFHSLLTIRKRAELDVHPKRGASWEGFALEQVLRSLDVSSEAAFFWATHGHAELDLLVHKGGKRLGFEFKYVDAPKLSRSMTIALEDLKLDRLTIVYPGKVSFELSSQVDVQPLAAFELSGFSGDR